MGFFERAWRSAGDEYGRTRAEKYGKWAKLLRTIQLLMMVALVIGIVHLYRTGAR